MKLYDKCFFCMDVNPGRQTNKTNKRTHTHTPIQNHRFLFQKFQKVKIFRLFFVIYVAPTLRLDVDLVCCNKWEFNGSLIRKMQASEPVLVYNNFYARFKARGFSFLQVKISFIFSKIRPINKSVDVSVPECR